MAKTYKRIGLKYEKLGIAGAIAELSGIEVEIIGGKGKDQGDIIIYVKGGTSAGRVTAIKAVIEARLPGYRFKEQVAEEYDSLV